MRKEQVEVGQIYRAKIPHRVASVQIIAEHPGGGWNGIVIDTGQEIRIRNAGQLWAKILITPPGPQDGPISIVFGIS
jgi:hypothetical protein